MNIKIIILLPIFFFLFMFASPFVFADEVVNPTTNISNNVITTKSFQIQIEYGSTPVINGGSNIELFENEVLVGSNSSVNGTKIQITKDSDYLPHKTYRLVVEGIDSTIPGTTFSNIDKTFKYSSLQRYIIGRTVEGRRIYAYTLGEGTQEYLFIGAIHGNEKNSFSVVDLLMKNFDLNHNLIPADTKLIFVPKLNVDGYRRGQRLNARKVDLNRNSKTSDWQSTTYWGYTKLINGGGTSPNSEPEIKAIHNLIKSYQPYMTFSYHSSGGFAITNGRYARSITRDYALRANYTYVDQSSGGTGFEYKITGDLTTWMFEKGYKAMTIELKSKEYSEISGNLKAVKYIINNY